jgi:acetyl-CoA carboxylase beta subunit
VECARKRLPVVCFLSSGGMQTKEGAGSLFSMPIVNDRITRFVRDNDLPILMFGFGDCTGGAQASFVTHPLATLPQSARVNACTTRCCCPDSSSRTPRT